MIDKVKLFLYLTKRLAAKAYGEWMYSYRSRFSDPKH
jgi:hypothetical protein